MGSVPCLSTQTAWCFWILSVLVIFGPSMFADSKPIHQPIDIARSHNISRHLVNIVTESLSNLQKNLGLSYACSYDVVDINDITRNETNTMKACLPTMHSESCICSKMNRTEFDEDKCLRAIQSDLKKFKNELQDLNPSINEIIKDLMQALNMPYDDKDEKDDEQKNHCSSFSCEMNQCDIMLSFRLRVITISRLFSYLKEDGLKQHKTWRQ